MPRRIIFVVLFLVMLVALHVCINLQVGYYIGLDFEKESDSGKAQKLLMLLDCKWIDRPLHSVGYVCILVHDAKRFINCLPAVDLIKVGRLVWSAWFGLAQDFETYANFNF